MTTLERPRSAPREQEAEALFKEARRRRRRRWTFAVCALAVSVTTLALLMALGPFTSGPPAQKKGPSSSTGSSTQPPEIVAWSGRSRLVVMSSLNGHVLRTLARDVATYRGFPSLAVSASGSVYFDEGNSVVRVPLAGGKVAEVVQGRSPALSPNGQFLAYVSGDAVGSSVQTTMAITVLDLVSGAQRSWQNTVLNSSVEDLSWSPDSRYVSFTSLTWGHAPPTPYQIPSYLILDSTAPSGSLSIARPIPLATGVAWAGFLSQTAGNLEGVGVTQHARETVLDAVNAWSGQIVKHLVTMRGVLATGNALDGPEGAIQVDGSEQNLLVASSGNGFGQLYRWSSGASGPTSIARGLMRAAWVPVGVR